MGTHGALGSRKPLDVGGQPSTTRISLSRRVAAKPRQALVQERDSDGTGQVSPASILATRPHARRPKSSQPGQGSQAVRDEVSLPGTGTRDLGKRVHTSEQRGNRQAAPRLPSPPDQVPVPSVAICATAQDRMNSGSGTESGVCARLAQEAIRRPNEGRVPWELPHQLWVASSLQGKLHPHAAFSPCSADHIKGSLPAGPAACPGSEAAGQRAALCSKRWRGCVRLHPRAPSPGRASPRHTHPHRPWQERPGNRCPGGKGSCSPPPICQPRKHPLARTSGATGRDQRSRMPRDTALQDPQDLPSRTLGDSHVGATCEQVRTTAARCEPGSGASPPG